MRIKRFQGGLLESNSYVIYQKGETGCFVVDLGFNPKEIIDFIKKSKLQPRGILLTHHHHDHTSGIEKFCRVFDCPIYIHQSDADIYSKQANIINDGEIFALGDEEIVAINTPGHSRGSVCYYSEKSKLAFTGDTIFNVDLGRTDLSDGSEIQLKNSTKNIIDKWSNEITIYPGHGDSSNMKFVRKNNQEFISIVNE
ncbi:MAG: MBL fold metallo-hydrolase [Anaerovoracaceae bacterium]